MLMDSSDNSWLLTIFKYNVDYINNFSLHKHDHMVYEKYD